MDVRNVLTGFSTAMNYFFLGKPERITTGLAIIGAGGCLISSSVGKLLSSYTWRDESGPNQNPERVTIQQVVKNCGIFGLGAAVVTFGAGITYLELFGLPKTEMQTCPARVEKAKADLLSCPAAAGVWYGMQAEGLINITCSLDVPEASVEQINSDGITSYNMALNPYFMPPAILYYLLDYRANDDSNPCRHTLQEYMDQAVDNEYYVLNKFSALVSKCINDGKWPASWAYNHLKPASFYAFIARTQGTFYRDVIRFHYLDSCNLKGLVDWCNIRWQEWVESPKVLYAAQMRKQCEKYID